MENEELTCEFEFQGVVIEIRGRNLSRGDFSESDLREMLEKTRKGEFSVASSFWMAGGGHQPSARLFLFRLENGNQVGVNYSSPHYLAITAA